MARTIIGLNDAKAVKRYSVALAEETFQKSFFGRNFFSNSGDNAIHVLTDLERQAGDSVTVDLFTQLSGQGVTGSATLKDKEESLIAHTQQIWLDQLRWGVGLGSRIDRKRTIHDLRDIAKTKLSNWWSRRLDEEIFIYLSGGISAETEGWLLSTGTVPSAGSTFVGNNTITAMDTAHKIFINGNTALNGLDSVNDTMRISFLEEINYKLKTMANPPVPIMIDGKERYILIMHPYDEYQLRSSTDWKAILQGTQQGQDKIFGEALGSYGKLILFSHPKVRQTNEAAGSAAASHNLLLGAQALFFLKGSPGGSLDFDWHEEVDDRGDKPVVDTAMIRGMQRSIFNNQSFGTMHCYTYGGAAVS